MKELSSSYGRVFIGPKEDCYRTAVFLAEGMRGKKTGAKHFTWALTGGSTSRPQAKAKTAIIAPVRSG